MTGVSKAENLITKSKKRSFPLLVFFLLVFFTLLSVGGIGIWTVERQMKENLTAQLKLILSSNIESLKIWAEGTKLDAQVLSRQPDIHERLVSLLEISESTSTTTETLRQSPELAWLRKNLGEACKTYGFVGFVLFDLTGLQIAAFLEEPIGTRKLLEKSDFFYRSKQGDTLISQPFPAEIDLPDENGVFHSNQTTMFVSTPIYNQSGEDVGVLAFRLRPEKEFTHLLSLSRFGETGETYAFNDDGYMVSNSRFDPQLLEMGLIQPGQKSIFNIQVRDPGRDLTNEKISPEEKVSEWPLTLMASQAIQNGSGVQVEGYNDYRGIPVVGAWAWIKEMDIGLTTEVDVNEAFRPIKTLLAWFFFLFALLMVFGATAFFLRSRYAQSQLKIIENEQRLSSFLNSAFDPIICIDIYGTIQSINPAVIIQFGYDSTELLGNNVKMLMPEPYQSEHDGYLQAFQKTGKRKILNMVREVPARRKNGTISPMELSVTESIVNGKISFLGIIRDISERKEAEKELLHAYTMLEERIHERTQELQESKNLAEKSNRSKSEFLARMSHELRTPMNAILGFAQLMQESTKDPLPKAHRNRTSQILKAGNHLLELINEVLDLSSIEAGKISVSMEPICIANLVEEVLPVVRPMSQKYNITLINEITPNKNIYVLADKTRLRQVLLNLISNGIKYNRKNGSVTLYAHFKEGSQLRIDVVDTGMGIPEEQFSQLFDPFNRLEADTGDIEGTGIGMTISKKLMEVMGGTISVKSSVGVGSTFSICLRCCQPSVIEAEDLPNTDIDLDCEDNNSFFTLLYIEDNPANLSLVEDILSNYKEVKLLAAENATIGIDIALSQKLDLILMDINLPGMVGIEALKRLKNFEETHSIPVIAISANAMKKDIDQTLAEGFKAYITKPINIGKFKKFIDNELKSVRTA